MKRKSILATILLLFICVLLYGNTGKNTGEVDYTQVVENPNVPATKIVADRNNEKGAKLDLTVKKLRIQKLQYKPKIERGNDGNAYYTFYFENTGDDYTYSVTDNRDDIPRNNKINNKLTEFYIQKDTGFKIHDYKTPKVLNSVTTVEEATGDSSIKKTDAVRIKMDENVTGDYLYISKVDNTTGDLLKVYSFDIFGQDRLAGDTPIYVAWTGLLFLGPNDPIPNDLKSKYKNGAIDNLENYQFGGGRFIFIGKIKSESSDRRIQCMMRTTGETATMGLGNGGIISLIANYSSSDAQNLWYDGGQVSGASTASEISFVTGPIEFENIKEHILENADGSKFLVKTVEYYNGSETYVTLYNLRRIRMMSYVKYNIFGSRDWAYGTASKSESYRHFEVNFPAVVHPGIYYMETRNFRAVYYGRIPGADWLWQSWTPNPETLETDRTATVVLYEKPNTPYMAMLVTRNHIKENLVLNADTDLVKTPETEASQLAGRVRIDTWINKTFGYNKTGYHPAFTYKDGSYNEAPFTIVKDADYNTKNTIEVRAGVNRGEYRFFIKPGAANNTGDDILLVNSTPQYLIDDNNNEDEFTVWYINYSSDITLNADFSNVATGTWTGWNPVSINNTATNTNIGKSYSGTKSGGSGDGAVLKKVTGKMFDSLEWIETQKKLVMGIDKIIAYDNGVAIPDTDIITDPASKKKMIRLRNERGEITAIVGFEGEIGGNTTNLGHLFIEKVRRDYKPHTVVVTPYDRKGYEFGTMTLNLVLDTVRPIGYIGAQISEEMLTAMKADNKTYYGLGYKDGTREIAGVGSVGGTAVQIPLFSEVSYNMGLGFNTTGISYNEITRKYTTGTGTEAEFNSLSGIIYMETQKGELKNKNFTDLTPITKKYLTFDEFKKDLSINMATVLESDAGNPNIGREVRFIVQAKKSGRTYGNTFFDDVLAETIEDNGEYFEIGVLPMVVPRTPDGDITLNTKTPTQYSYLSKDGVTPYTYKLGNQLTDFNKDLGSEARNNVVSTRPNVSYGARPNGSLPSMKSSFGTNQSIFSNVNIVTPMGTTNSTTGKYEDPGNRYEIALGSGGIHTNLDVKIEMPFVLNETVTITNTYNMPGMTTPIVTGKTNLHLISGEVLVGSADLDFSKVRKNDTLRWDTGYTSENIIATVNSMARTYPGVTLTNVQGKIYIGDKQFNPDIYDNFSITFNGETKTNTPGTRTVPLTNFDIGFEGTGMTAKFFIKKKVDQLPNGPCVITAFDKAGNKIAETTINITDSPKQNVYTDEFKILNLSKYYIPAESKKINYISETGELFTDNTTIINSPVGNSGNKKIFITSSDAIDNSIFPMDLLGIKGEINHQEYYKKGGSTQEDKLFGYDSKGTGVSPRVIIPMYLAQNNVGTKGMSLSPVYTSNEDFNTIISNTGTKSELTRTDEIINWRTSDNRLVSTTLKAKRVDYKTSGNGTLDLHKIPKNTELSWIVDAPQLNGENLTFATMGIPKITPAMGETIGFTPKFTTTGDFFPTRLTSTDSFISVTGNVNIPKTLSITRTDNGVNKGSQTATGTNSEVKITYPDIEIGIRNGEFYIKKLVDKLPDLSRYVITASNDNGELGEYTFEISDKNIDVLMGNATLKIYNNLSSVMVSDTPSMDWIAGNGNIYSGVDTTSKLEAFGKYLTYTDTINYSATEPLRVEKIDDGMTDLVLGADGSYGNEIWLPKTTGITNKLDMALNDIKIKVGTLPKTYTVVLKDRYEDRYSYTYVVENMNNITMNGATGELDLSSVTNGTTLKWNLENKAHTVATPIMDTTNAVELKFDGQAPYLMVEGQNIPRQLKITEGANTVTGTTGNANNVVVATQHIEIGLENGLLTVKKLMQSMVDRVYTIDVIGADGTSMGTFTLTVKGQPPKKITGVIDIDNRLLVNRSADYITTATGIANKNQMTQKVEAPLMLEYSSLSKDTIAPIEDIMELKKGGVVQTLQKTTLGNMTVYNDEIFVENGVTATTTEELIKHIYYSVNSIVASGTQKSTTYKMTYLGTDKNIYELTAIVMAEVVSEGTEGSIYLSGKTKGNYTYELANGMTGNNIDSTPSGVTLEGTNISFIEDSFKSNVLLNKIGVKVNGGTETVLNSTTYTSTGNTYSINLANTDASKNMVVVNKIEDVFYTDTLEITGYYNDVALGTFKLNIQNLVTTNGTGEIDLSLMRKQEYVWLPMQNTNGQTTSITHATGIIKWNSNFDDIPITQINGKSIVGKITGSIKNVDLYGKDVVGSEVTFTDKTPSVDGSLLVSDKSQEIEIGFNADGQFVVKYNKLVSVEDIVVSLDVYDTRGFLLGKLNITLKLNNIQDLEQTIKIDGRLVEQYGPSKSWLHINKIEDNGGTPISDDLHLNVDKFIDYTDDRALTAEMKASHMITVKDRTLIIGSKTGFAKQATNTSSILTDTEIAMDLPFDLLNSATMSEFARNIKLNLGEYIDANGNIVNRTQKDELIYLNPDNGIIYRVTLNIEVIGGGYESAGSVDIGGLTVGDYVEFRGKQNTEYPELVGTIRGANGVEKPSLTGDQVKIIGLDTGDTFKFPTVTSYVDGTKNMLNPNFTMAGDGFTLEMSYDNGDIVLKITKTKDLVQDTDVVVTPISTIKTPTNLILGKLNLKVSSMGVVIDPDVGGKGILDFGQLLYDSNGDYHYGEALVGVKGLVGEKNIRLDIQKPNIQLTNTTGDKINVVNMKADLITPKSDVDGKAQFMISGEAEVLKTTKVGKYNGEVTIDVYIDL